MDEEVVSGGDPAFATVGESATSDDAVEVGMVGQVLRPSVQHGDEADGGAEVFGIGGQGEERAGGRAEEKVVAEHLVRSEERVEV